MPKVTTAVAPSSILPQSSTKVESSSLVKVMKRRLAREELDFYITLIAGGIAATGFVVARWRRF